MAVFLSPVGGAAVQFFDNSGQVLTGGLLYTYLAGTTTPAATYTSNTGTQFHTNPIILDASGRIPNGGEVWLAQNIQYKFVLKDANSVLIGTWDNIIGINSNFLNYSVQEETQTATQGQTVFTLATITYTVGTNSLAVYVNGSKQIPVVNYVETDSTTVTFVSGLNVGDVVDFTTAVSLSSGVTAANLVTFTGVKGQTGVVQDIANADGSDWIGFEAAGTGAVAVDYSVQDKLRQIVSVKDFGAVGNGVVDDTVAIQAAVTFAATNEKTLLFPAGNYLSTSGGITLTPGTSIIGQGQGITTLTLGDSATAAYFFYSGSNASPGLYQFSDFTITGSWLTNQTTNGLALIVLNFATTPTPTSIVTFNNIEVSYSRGFGIVTDLTARSEARDCYVHHTIRDGISFNDTQDKIFINCQVEHTADNALSGHVVNGFGQTPVTSRLTMENCRMIDTYGASFLGVSEATVSNVYCARSKGIAFSIGSFIPVPSSGYISTRHISIKNLVVEDTINQSVLGTGTAAVGLQIGSYSAAGTLTALPLRPNGTGSILPPEPYIYNLGNSSNTVTVPNGAGWDVQAIIRQTLPAVANYSSWGFGDMFGPTGFIDPAITDANLGIQGIVLYGGMRDARIRAIVEPRAGGVLISEPSSPDYLYQNVVFENCSFVRCVGNAINSDAVSSDIQDIKFLNCWFDVDPRFESADRAQTAGQYNGKWQFASTTAIVQGATYVTGIGFENCHFRNCQSLDTSGAPVNYYGLNYLHCNPATVGGSSGNVGIGDVKPAGGNFAYVVEVSDPRQTATYNNIVTVQTFDAASIPTTGTWVAGAFVRKNNPAVGGPTFTFGWSRLTTGSANVSGTDWTPVVVAVS
jgi:hypothetical protein